MALAWEECGPSAPTFASTFLKLLGEPGDASLRDEIQVAHEKEDHARLIQLLHETITSAETHCMMDSEDYSYCASNQPDVESPGDVQMTIQTEMWEKCKPDYEFVHETTRPSSSSDQLDADAQAAADADAEFEADLLASTFFTMIEEDFAEATAEAEADFAAADLAAAF
eukprot:tig00000215_g18538.t1